MTQGRLGWALAGALLVAVRLRAVPRRSSSRCWRSCAATTRRRAPALAQLLRAWWGEVLLGAARVLLAAAVSLPAPSRTHLPAACAGRRGVVLVHGFVCNRGFWNPWMRRLRQAGRALRRGEPGAGVRLASTTTSPIIEQAVQPRARRPPACAPVVVAHSMGGLAVRALAGARAAGDGASHHVVTIGSPHRGTWLARFGAHAQRPADAAIERLAELAALDGARAGAALRRASPASTATATTSCSRRRPRRCRAPTTGTCPAAPTCTWRFSPRCSARSGAGWRCRPAGRAAAAP